MQSILIKIFVLIIPVLLIFSCSNKQHYNLAQLHIINNGLRTASVNTDIQNEIIYRAIEEKLNLRDYKEIVEIWLPKAFQIKQNSAETSGYIEGLKKELKEEANLNISADGKEIFNEEDKDPVNAIFFKKAKGNELYERIRKYRNDILNEDTLLKQQFEKTLPIPIDKTANDFTQIYFTNISTMEALNLLSNFQLLVKTAESQTLTFCHAKTAIQWMCGFGRGPKLLVTQSSNYVKAGEKNNITAGMGNYTIEGYPTFSINGKEIALGDYNYINYNFKAANKAGRYTVPVKAVYLDESGVSQTITQLLQYEVAKEIDTTK